MLLVVAGSAADCCAPECVWNPNSAWSAQAVAAGAAAAAAATVAAGAAQETPPRVTAAGEAGAGPGGGLDGGAQDGAHAGDLQQSLHMEADQVAFSIACCCH